MSGTTGGLLAGIATMTLNGDAWDVVSDLAWQASTVARETLKGQTAVEGYSEMPTQCWITAKLRDRAGASVGDLMNQGGSITCIVMQANGKTISGANMWCTELSEVETQSATFTVKFENGYVVEGVV